MYKRSGFKWNINECLRLHREFELLQLSIDEISVLHERTPKSIMYKLDSEGLADYNVLYSNYHKLNSPIPIILDDNKDSTLESDNDSNDISDYYSDLYNLKDHVYRLETQMEKFWQLFINNSSSNKDINHNSSVY
jgi:hypothetical protein